MLKPCPFCGKDEGKVIEGTDYLGDRGPMFFVHCEFCGADGGECSTSEIASNEWNTRHNPVKDDMAAALKAAFMFIKNGISLGYIRMPDEDVPDTAKLVPGIINAVLASYEAEAKP